MYTFDILVFCRSMIKMTEIEFIDGQNIKNSTFIQEAFVSLKKKIFFIIDVLLLSLVRLRFIMFISIKINLPISLTSSGTSQILIFEPCFRLHLPFPNDTLRN